MCQGKLGADYLDVSSTVEMNVEDMARLGLQNESKVRLRTPSRRVDPALQGPRDEGPAAGPPLHGLRAAFERAHDGRHRRHRDAALQESARSRSSPCRTTPSRGEDRRMSDDNIRTVTDATCTFCGCVCDDIVLTVDLDHAQHHQVAERLRARQGVVQGARHRGAAARADRRAGGHAPRKRVEAAAQILAEARFPVIYGLSDTTCEAQRVAVSIARHDRRQRGHHHLGLSRPDRHGVPGPWVRAPRPWARSGTGRTW